MPPVPGPRSSLGAGPPPECSRPHPHSSPQEARKVRRKNTLFQSTAKSMYTSLLFPSHWPHAVARKAGKCSLYYRQPCTSLNVGGSITIEEEANATGKQPVVLPISPASSFTFYTPGLLHFSRPLHLLLSLPGALTLSPPHNHREFLAHLFRPLERHNSQFEALSTPPPPHRN